MEQVSQLEEAEALEELGKAQSWPTNTVHDLALIELWRGLAHAGLSHRVEAEKSFDSALHLEPSLSLPASTSPRVREWWAAARKRSGSDPQSPGPVLTEVLSPPRNVPPPRGLLSSRNVGMALLAVAVVGLGTSLYFGQRAAQTHQQAVAEPQVGAAQSLQRTAGAQASTSNVLLAVGLGAGAAGGVIWAFDF